MAKYDIFLKKSAAKELEEVPRKVLQKIVKKIQALAINPRPQSSQKLSHREQYRIRHGNYRIIYSVQDNEHSVHVVKIGHRREIYRT